MERSLIFDKGSKIFGALNAVKVDNISPHEVPLTQKWPKEWAG